MFRTIGIILTKPRKKNGFKHLYEEDNDKKNTWKEVNGKLIKIYNRF